MKMTHMNERGPLIGVHRTDFPLRIILGSKKRTLMWLTATALAVTVFTIYSTVSNVWQTSFPASIFKSSAMSRPSVVNKRYFNFSATSSFYNRRINRYHLKKVDIIKWRELIIPALPRHLRRSAGRFLLPGLKLAEKYNVDPFWVLAVMWTESHFKIHAKSHVGARGLMQVMPGTSHYIENVWKRRGHRPVYESSQTFALQNLEKGIYYLQYLGKKFRGNLKLATVAYNMGPNWVLRRLRTRRPVGVKNLYLDKISKNYKKLTARFIKESRPTPFWKLKTFVSKARKAKTSKSDKIYSWAVSPYVRYKYAYTEYITRKDRKLRLYIYRPIAKKLQLDKENFVLLANYHRWN